MTTTKSNLLLPYLEDTGLDGKKLYTPKEWTKRLRHYIKRSQIKPLPCNVTRPTLQKVRVTNLVVLQLWRKVERCEGMN